MNYRERHFPASGRLQFAVLMGIVLTAGLGPLLGVGPVTSARVFSVVFIICGLSYVARTRSLTSLLPPIFGLLFGLCLLFGVEEITASSIFESFLYLGYGLMATIIAQMSFTPRQIRQISYALVVIGIIAALSAIYEDYTGFNWHTGGEILIHDGVRRSNGLHGNPSATASFILLGVVTSIFFVLERDLSKKAKYVISAVLVVLLWGIYTTASRGAIIALFLALSPLAIGKRFSLTTKVCLLIVLVGMFANYDYLSKGRRLSLTADDSGIARAATMHAHFEEFLQNPLVGFHGKRSFDSKGAHNNFLTVMSDGGFISLLPFISIHWAIFRRFWSRRHDKFGLMLFSIFIGQVGIGMSHTIHTNVIFWSIIGLCLNDHVSCPKQARITRTKHLSPDALHGLNLSKRVEDRMIAMIETHHGHGSSDGTDIGKDID